jgi:hypothetical protein
MKTADGMSTIQHVNSEFGVQDHWSYQGQALYEHEGNHRMCLAGLFPEISQIESSEIEMVNAYDNHQ